MTTYSPSRDALPAVGSQVTWNGLRCVVIGHTIRGPYGPWHSLGDAPGLLLQGPRFQRIQVTLGQLSKVYPLS
jgi:hypothetical protein